MKNKNWFWGIAFLLAAVFMLATPFGAFGQIGALSVLATIFAAALCIQSVMQKNFFGAFFSLALLYLVYQKPLHLVNLSFWFLMLVVLLLTIGCSLLFGGRRWYNVRGSHHYHGNSPSMEPEHVDSNNPKAEVNFQSLSEYLHADALRSGWFSSSFGQLAVYFDQAHVAPEGAEIHVECSFGSVQLYIPKEWRVTDQMETSFGSVECDVPRAVPQEGAPRLTLVGEVSFGSIQIHYI